jgi:hypothetical protein
MVNRDDAAATRAGRTEPANRLLRTRGAPDDAVKPVPRSRSHPPRVFAVAPVRFPDVAARDRPIRFLFFLQHAGYLRHYAEPIRLLAHDGHSVHIALGADEKSTEESALVSRLIAEVQVTSGRAPERSATDKWRPIAWLVRAFADLARYSDPRFAETPALRDRVADTIERQTKMKEGGIDRLSAWLLRQTIGRLIGYLVSHSDARIARRTTRLFLALERSIPSSRAIERYLEEHRPDAVLVTPLVDIASPQADFLKSARALGVPSALCVASWDNLSGKGLVKPKPDRVVVWNETQRREAVELHGIPADDVVVTGAQRFDEWFERRAAATAQDFRDAVGLRREVPYLLYLCSSRFIVGDETPFVLRWVRGLRESTVGALADAGILIRPHPQNAEHWSNVDVSAFENAVVWPLPGEHPDSEEARATFYDSIAHSAAVVGVNTSALIEATILGKGTYTLLDPTFAATQAGTLHFHYLLHEQGGVLRTADTVDEHHRQLAEALAGSGDDPARFREFLGRFVRPRGLEAPAAALVAHAITEVAELDRVSRGTPVGDLAIRCLLGPAAALSWIALNFGSRRRLAAGTPRVGPR